MLSRPIKYAILGQGIGYFLIRVKQGIICSEDGSSLVTANWTAVTTLSKSDSEVFIRLMILIIR